MTIQTTFQFGQERINVRIIDTAILFIDLQTNMMSPIEGLKFSKEGTMKEHPDLKDNENWRQIAIERFVKKIKDLPSETKRMEWIIKELKEMGYTPIMTQRFGHRPQKVK